jgi:hypothetical protein
MTRTPDAQPVRQPSIADLTDRWLTTQVASPLDAEATGAEVEPHEILAGFRVDPRTAWTDALAALKAFGVNDLPAGMASEWANWAAAIEHLAVPLAAGQFPQQVRDLQTLLTQKELQSCRPTGGKSLSGFAGLRTWLAKQNQASPALQAVARGIGHHLNESVPVQGLPTTAEQNEVAAGLWLAGRAEEALDLWLKLADHPVVLFNRGMALLFCGRIAQAVSPLKAASQQLAESSGWSHLAKLYLALAESRLTSN